MPEEKEDVKVVLEEVELADGTKINVLREDKFNEVQEGFTKSKSEWETKLSDSNTELEKERAKEKNFANLRSKKLSELSDEEKSALSEEKREIMEMREQIATERADDLKVRADGWKIAAFKNLGLVDPEGKILDEDQYKKIDASMARLNDPEDSADAVLKKAKAAYSLEFGNQPNIGERSINAAVPFGGGGNTPTKAKGMNEVQKGVAAQLGIDLEAK